MNSSGHFLTPKKLLLRMICILAVVFVVVYGFSARMRATAIHEGKLFSTNDGGLYSVDYYRMHHPGQGFLQLRRVADGALLAEREFEYGYYDPIKMFWDDDGLVYDSNDTSMFYDGVLRLPPNRIDRLLALLP